MFSPVTSISPARTKRATSSSRVYCCGMETSRDRLRVSLTVDAEAISDTTIGAISHDEIAWLHDWRHARAALDRDARRVRGRRARFVHGGGRRARLHPVGRLPPGEPCRAG